MAFGQSVLNEPERFAGTIRSVPLSIAEWRKQQTVYLRADMDDPFEWGFSAFCLNRCNRSGVVRGAGPMGGYAQKGRWGMDARFYRESLATRVFAASERPERICLNKDAQRFLIERLPRESGRKRVFAYLEPPCYVNGKGLCLNACKDEDHRDCACYTQGRKALKWVLFYDDAPFIRDAHANCAISHCSLQYRLRRRRKTRELLIEPRRVRLPDRVDAVA